MEKSRRKKKPGFISYHEFRGSVNALSDEEAGKLFKACFDYSMEGLQPNDLPARASVLWPLIMARIDEDTDSYRQKSRDSQYAAYCRDQKNAGNVPDDRETWEARYPE